MHEVTHGPVKQHYRQKNDKAKKKKILAFYILLLLRAFQNLSCSLCNSEDLAANSGKIQLRFSLPSLSPPPSEICRGGLGPAALLGEGDKQEVPDPPLLSLLTTAVPKGAGSSVQCPQPHSPPSPWLGSSCTPRGGAGLSTSISRSQPPSSSGGKGKGTGLLVTQVCTTGYF